MGFSVSAASVIVFIGVLISVSLLYTTAANNAELMTDARSDAQERALEQRNADLNVTSVSYNGSVLVVNATNTGATTLSVEDTDVVVDNQFEPGTVTKVAGGEPGSTLWVPGEQLHIEVEIGTKPDRVTVVTDPGVAETEGVP